MECHNVNTFARSRDLTCLFKCLIVIIYRVNIPYKSGNALVARVFVISCIFQKQKQISSLFTAVTVCTGDTDKIGSIKNVPYQSFKISAHCPVNKTFKHFVCLRALFLKLRIIIEYPFVFKIFCLFVYV